MTTETIASDVGATDTASVDAPRARRRLNMRPLLLGLVALILLAVSARVGYNYWLDSTLYISTEDALVDAAMTTVTTSSGGTLAVWRVKPGDRVRVGQAIGLVKPAPGAASGTSFDVLAPMSATSLRVDGKEGQIIGASQPLAYIADLDHLRVTAFIDETAIHAVKIGQPVDITVDATGAVKYDGTVAEILPAAASQFALIPSTDRGTGNFTKVTRRVEVHIALNSANAQLYPGENAYVRIHR